MFSLNYCIDSNQILQAKSAIYDCFVDVTGDDDDGDV